MARGLFLRRRENSLRNSGRLTSSTRLTITLEHKTLRPGPGVPRPETLEEHMIPRSITRAARLTAVAAALLAALALAVPQAQAQQPPAKPKDVKISPAEPSKPEHVEKRIADLREKLRITPAQEPAWNDLAKVMRDNAAKMKTLLDKWSAQNGGTTAVENLKLHLEMADEHAQGLRQLIPAFEKLYGSMSAEQKKTADDVFAGRMHRGKKKGMKGM